MYVRKTTKGYLKSKDVVQAMMPTSRCVGAYRPDIKKTFYQVMMESRVLGTGYSPEGAWSDARCKMIV